jgi:hypothetical protein
MENTIISLGDKRLHRKQYPVLLRNGTNVEGCDPESSSGQAGRKGAQSVLR